MAIDPTTVVIAAARLREALVQDSATRALSERTLAAIRNLDWALTDQPTTAPPTPSRPQNLDQATAAALAQSVSP